MSKHKELIYISNLIDIYGELLTKKQLDYINLYYFEDLSLNEISEEFNVSKNAVYDSIQKSISNLKDIDSKLKIIEKRKARKELYEKIENKEIKNKLMEIDELI